MSTDPRIPASQRSRIDERLRRRFETPSRRFGPTPLWWWSGEPVTDERLEWQMRRFSDGGIDNLVLINLAPSGPQFDAEADDPPWFSDAWWQRVEHACELARELDMRLWFYDQIGFSGANLQGSITREHPWAAGSTLRRRQGESRGGRAVLQAGEALVAAYTPDGTLRETSDDGILLDAPSDSSLDLITAVPTAFDYLSQDAVRLLMDRVHGEFDRRVPQHLGTVIAGSFQDELPSTNPWTPSFLDEFAARRGYDLRPRLQALFGRTDVSGAKVRSDYYAVRTELTEEALFRPLRDWHDERGMLLGADQSNPARAGLPAQSTQIYTDYPRTHRHVSAVGSDHEGDSKFHASLAKLYGHERVWLEAFHSSGWGGTLEETWDWLMPFLRRGATLYNPHATYFSTVGGWFEWAPPSTDWRQPYWQHYRQFADAVARVTSTMTWGRSDADVAVLHPTATMQASLPLDMPITHFGAPDFDGALTDVARTQRIYLDLVGKDDWFHFHASALDRAGIGFDIVDDASVARAAPGGGRISVGEGSWSVVIVPSAVFLEESTATMLLDHLDGGGRVIVVGALPEHACGAAGDDGVVRALAGHRKLERVSGAEEAIAALHGVRDAQYARTDAPMLVRRAGRSAIALVGGAYPNGTAHPLRPEAGLERVTDYDFDRERYVRRRRIRV
ncbi:MAG: glycosyl hydrolase, partial [Microbacterium sp.]